MVVIMILTGPGMRNINLVYKYEDGILSMSSVPADSSKYSPVFTKITSSSELKDVEAEISEAASKSK